MNQILYPSPEEPSRVSIPPKKTLFLKYQLYISVVAAVLSILLLFRVLYSKSAKERYSQSLLQTYQITTLYAATPLSTTTEMIEEEESVSFIVGAIRIDQIRIHYPILSTYTEENLKIAPCRISGPLPNVSGNLCIAGHNYVDTKFFSRLHELNLQDTFWVYDLMGNAVEYGIYAITEVPPDDLSCLEPTFKDTREVTLITCNNVTGNRLIVKAVEI